LATWFEQYPERLEHELQALRDAGFTAEVDQAASGAGVLVLAVRCRIKDSDHVMRVEFPSAYPYFPFQVFAPSLSLARHQDPYSKALCFVARIDSEWSTDDTVAKYLGERLPIILRANEIEGPFESEAHEGAPVTPYFPFLRENVVLIGDWSVTPESHRGTLLIGMERGTDANVILRGAVRQIKDADGTVLGELESRLSQSFAQHFPGRWVRLPTKPQSADPILILAEVERAWPALRTPNFQRGPDVIGIVFPDEVRYKEMQDTWIFLMRRRTGGIHKSKKKAVRAGELVAVHLVRSDRVGQTDLQARVPRLAPIAKKKAVLFGLGALGSMVGWQLARAGIGRLAVVDNDFVNAATTPRWILGLSAAGRDKVTVFAELLQREYPLVDVTPIYLRVGHAAFNPVADEAMRQALDGADVIIDCTVERTVHHYLSSNAWRKGIPYIWTSGTPGGWGGIVGRISSTRSRGCWKCFCGHLSDGTVPEPQSEDGPDIQPVGCDAPTFRGAGFDMDTVAIMCARLAASTLSAGTDGGYGDFEWDVAVVNLWKDGHPIAPEWKTFDLTEHPGCDAHN
jgi:molybdopterin/thiamine biosynthesis adenylyltransferase